jgi:ribosomal protein L29
MTHLKSREIDTMSEEAREQRLAELKDEMLQLRAQQALGGSASNLGAYKATRRSIARLLTKIRADNRKE